MSDLNLKNNLHERETLAADEERISRLVGSLDKVSAPKDFDFRLKARIAAARENDVRPAGIWQALRFGLPLSATFAVAAFVLIQAGLFSPEADRHPVSDVVVAENQKTPPPVNYSNSVNAAENRQIIEVANSALPFERETVPAPVAAPPVERPENELTARVPAEQRKVKLRPAAVRQDDDVMSRDIGATQNKDRALTPSNININPAGINPEKKAPSPEEVIKGNLPTIGEILNTIGAETVPDGKKLRVRSVRENSPAARSGVRVGDIIEAIDDQRLDGETLSPKFSGGKTLTVVRGGEVLKIELKAN
jgi:hypothetical protein